MKVETLKLDGKKGSIEVTDKVFFAKINKKLVSTVLYKTNANYKKRHAKTKQQNEVSGPTSKIYAQKGTGNARHASKKAPIFVGGGVAHGPKGNVYKVKKINKKIKKAAIAQSLSEKNRSKNLFIITDVKKEVKKTKSLNNFLINNRLTNSLLITDDETFKNLKKSAKNIKNIKMINNVGTNVLDILKYKNVLITQTSLKNIEGRLLNEKN